MGENIAIHDAYDAAFKELGERNKKIVSLKADVAPSIKGGILGKVSPKRYLNVGISELGMVSTLAGFAREGLTPFVNIFAVFLTIKGAGPIQSLIAYDKLNVKLCGTYCGFPDSYDGASHQAITDPTFVRTVPNMMVITVVDAVETRKVVFVIADHQGPIYLRLSRMAAPMYYSEDMKLEIGKGIMARDGRDMTITTTGITLYKTLVAAELPEVEGIQARVVDVHAIKPADEELIIECARETGVTVTTGEHSVCDGLGSVAAGILAGHVPVPMTRIGATDFMESGDYKQPSVKYGYGPESIAERCTEMIKRK